MLYGGLRDATKICHPFGLELRPILQPRLSSPRRPPVPSKSFPEGGWWGGGGAFVSGSWSETQYPAGFSFLRSLSPLTPRSFFFPCKDSHLAQGST